MNKLGQSSIYLFMIAIIFFFIGINLAYPLVQTVGESMLQLNCTPHYLTNSTLDNQTKIYCVGLDTFSFLFVGLAFGLGGLLLVNAFR